MLGGMYFVQPEPIDEVANAALTAMRRPVLRSTEWLERHDLDTETLALELPPDQIFGPLPLEEQMKFLITALQEDNELGDNYLTRIIIDHIDLSLDPPALGDLFVTSGASKVLDFAVADFTETRFPRKHKFFPPDQFLRFVSLCASHAELVEKFVNKQDGVALIFRALEGATEPYARVLAMRALTLFAFVQREDGKIERDIIACGGFEKLMSCYRESTGDPTDTRYTTMLLSSLMRKMPNVVFPKFLEHDGVLHTISNLNICKYKGLSQHLRVLRDALRIGRDRNSYDIVEQLVYDGDFLSVGLGVLDVFHDYYECATEIVELLSRMRSHSTPMEFLEYRAVQVFAKFLHKYGEERDDDTMRKIYELCQWVMEDPQVKPFLTGGPMDLRSSSRYLEEMMKKHPVPTLAAAGHPPPVVAPA